MLQFLSCIIPQVIVAWYLFLLSSFSHNLILQHTRYILSFEKNSLRNLSVFYKYAQEQTTFIKYFPGAEICVLGVLFQLILTKIPVGWILSVPFRVKEADFLQFAKVKSLESGPKHNLI